MEKLCAGADKISGRVANGVISSKRAVYRKERTYLPINLSLDENAAPEGNI